MISESALDTGIINTFSVGIVIRSACVSELKSRLQLS